MIVTFFALLAFWTHQRFISKKLHPGAAAALGPVRTGTVAARAVGLLLFVVVVVVAVTGSPEATKNPVATWFWVWFWVGLASVSVLLGPVWRWINPLRSIAAALTIVLRLRSPRPIPSRWGIWPATAVMVPFLWLELVDDKSVHPATIVTFLALYSAVTVAGGVIYGQAWFPHADGFEVYSTLFGHLAPIYRRADGKLGLRNPLSGLATVPITPGLPGFICLILGSTAFDGLSRQSFWRNMVSDMTRTTRMLAGTTGLLITVAAIFATYTLAARSAERHLRASRRLDQEFAHSLLPIALGYSVAHYFSFAIFQGQAGYLLASDPFDRGWNWFGISSTSINYTVVSAHTIALVQIGGVVLGHIVGVISAHDHAIGIFPRRVRMRGQYALLSVMVGYTVGGLALVAGT